MALFYVLCFSNKLIKPLLSENITSNSTGFYSEMKNKTLCPLIGTLSLSCLWIHDENINFFFQVSVFFWLLHEFFCYTFLLSCEQNFCCVYFAFKASDLKWINKEYAIFDEKNIQKHFRGGVGNSDDFIDEFNKCRWSRIHILDSSLFL